MPAVSSHRFCNPECRNPRQSRDTSSSAHPGTVRGCGRCWSTAVLAADFFMTSDRIILFPIFYIFPVLLVAWHGRLLSRAGAGRRPLSFARLGFSVPLGRAERTGAGAAQHGDPPARSGAAGRAHRRASPSRRASCASASACSKGCSADLRVLQGHPRRQRRVDPAGNVHQSSHRGAIFPRRL